jgi:hypothetical protein
LEEHPVGDGAHVAAGVVGDVEQPGQQDLALGAPEVDAAFDGATAGRGFAQGPGGALGAGDGAGLAERRPGCPPPGLVVGTVWVGSKTLTSPTPLRQTSVAASRSALTEDRMAGPSQSRMPAIAAVVLPELAGPTSATAPRSPCRRIRAHVQSRRGAGLGGHEPSSEAPDDKPSGLGGAGQDRGQVAVGRELGSPVHAERAAGRAPHPPARGAGLEPATTGSKG